MKEVQRYKPILFSTEMVKANSDGRKTKTRRIVDDKHTGFLEYAFKEKKNLAYWVFTNAKYRMGDILWVRETHIDVGDKAYEYFNGVRFHYKADETFVGCWPWKPSIHMPKEAARQFLKVFSVRVERLQDISNEDSISEGIEIIGSEDEFIFYKNYQYETEKHQVPKNSFMSLWQKINGKNSWNENPFVWVYEYEIIQKPEGWPL